MGASLLTIPRVDALTYNEGSSLYRVRVNYIKWALSFLNKKEKIQSLFDVAIVGGYPRSKIMGSGMTSISFPNLHIVKHPLVQHKLAHLRNRHTGMVPFRQLLKEIALLLGYEITRQLPLFPLQVETPLTQTEGAVVDKSALVVVPVLRAGLGMTEGLLDLVPFAQVGHIGLYRHPETALPVHYFVRFPAYCRQFFIVLDPMLATGHSAVEAVQAVLNHGVPPEKILFLALIVSPEGMTVFNTRFPDIPVYAASLDEKLDSHFYILPGLGDAGDRLFGTL